MEPHANGTNYGVTDPIGYAAMFYVLPPHMSMFKDVGNVPNYVNSVTPHFFIFIILENIILFMKGHRSLRINDKMTSLGAGTYMGILNNLGLKSSGTYLYIYVYEHYRIYELPWDHVGTWFAVAIAVDFAYYWFHRAAHEINIFWASHSTHHSSEDYNLTTALRQSSVQSNFSAIFYLPLALFMPPSILLVHQQFNLLYQFWIHTELIDRLGPLEYILNTPSHHRVHHGRNRYCIDKNYAGTLIIWDRMFGTFEAEKKDETVVYGLVVPINSFEPTYVQFGYFKYVLSKCWNEKGLKNKLSVLFKGPGWSPGKTRLGDINEIPEIENPVIIYDNGSTIWLNIYVIVHFLVEVTVFQQTLIMHSQLPYYAVLIACAYMLLTMTAFGYLFDKRSYANTFELIRCITCSAFFFYFQKDMEESMKFTPRMCNVIALVYQFSTIAWSIQMFRPRTTKEKTK